MAFELDPIPSRQGTVAVYLFLSTSNTNVLPDGVTPATTNMVMNRILWDGVSAYTVPPNVKMIADTGQAIGDVVATAVAPIVPPSFSRGG